MVCDTLGSLANIGAVYFAWKSIQVTLAEQKRVRENEKNNVIISQRMLWYNQIVLEDVMKELTELLEHVNREIDGMITNTPLDDIQGETLFRIIEFEFQIMIEKIMVIKIFNKELYQTCKFLLETMLDLYTESVEKMMSVSTSVDNSVSKVQQCKIEIFEKLYYYGNDMACGVSCCRE